MAECVCVCVFFGCFGFVQKFVVVASLSIYIHTSFFFFVYFASSLHNHICTKRTHTNGHSGELVHMIHKINVRIYQTNIYTCTCELFGWNKNCDFRHFFVFLFPSHTHKRSCYFIHSITFKYMGTCHIIHGEDDMHWVRIPPLNDYIQSDSWITCIDFASFNWMSE